MSWQYALIGLFAVLALIGALSLLFRKNETRLPAPWRDPRSSQHRDYAVGREAK